MMELEDDILYQIDLIEKYVKDQSQIPVILACTKALRRKVKRLINETEVEKYERRK
jgi:hypothetical protein